MSDKTKICLSLMATAILVIAVAIYYYIDPETSGLMPRCPMLILTGYKCPSCGIQRAIHQLLHGNIAEAARYNYFLVLATPYLFAIIAAKIGCCTKRFHAASAEAMHYLCHPKTLIAYVVLFLAWWIVRNVVDI